MNRNWYAVYTKAECERKVAAALSKKKIQNFCPHNRVITGYEGKKKIVYTPLFPSFVFVHITEAEMSEVRKTNDVFNFVFWLGQPAVIKTTEIENIAQFNSQHYNIKIEKCPVNATGVIRISNEPKLMDHGREIVLNTTKIRLTLPSIGFVLCAESEMTEQMQYESQNHSILI